MKDWEALAKEVEEAYLQGFSDVEVCRVIGITMKQFKDLYASQPKFATLVDMGRTMQQAWWEAQCRENLRNKSFNVNMWAFNMKNRFGWADKVEQTVTSESLTESEIDKELARLLKAKDLREKEVPESEILLETSSELN